MLLTAAILAPHAHAQDFDRGILHKTTADKVLSYPYEIRTGIVFHASGCSNPNRIVLQTRTDDFDLVSYYVSAQGQIGARVGAGDSSEGIGRVHYLELVGGRDSLPDGPLTVKVKLCGAAPSDYTVTIATWHDQGMHSDRPASSHVRDIAPSQDTGIAIHRSASTCRFTDVQLAANAPNWLELRKHRANGTADGAGGQRFTVRMEKDHADDRHVRVRFKDNASPAPGSHVFSIVMERTAASGAGCTAASAAAYTLGYTLNISLGAIWERERTLNSDSVSSYSADALGGSFALAMGPRIHRSSSLCRWTDASLVAGGSFLVLQRHATAGGVAVGAPAASVSDVRMQRGASGDQYLSLIYRRNTPVPAGTLTAAVELKPSARCASYAGIPGPLTLTFTATIGAAATNTEPWIIKTGFARSAPTISVFSPVSIYNARLYQEIHTGIFIGRRTATCNDYYYNLLNHRDIFLVGYYPSNRGYLDDEVPDDSFGRGNRGYNFGNNDGGFGLLFQVGARPVPNTTITLHVALSKHPNCGNPTPTTLSYTMSFGPLAPWGTLANNVATVTTLFRPSQLSAAASATDTGIRFNRGTAMSVCTNVDVELASGNRTHLELQKYNGTTADGAAAASFGGLTMHAGATGRPVGVQFKAGVSIAAGALKVAVIAKPASNCNHGERPAPLTVNYELVVGERQPWRIHDDFDSMGRVVRLYASQRNETVTGLRVHRSLSGCSSMDVSLPADAPAWAMLQQYGPSGPVGARARTQTAVPMTGSGAASDRHVMLMIVPSGTPLPNARLTMSVTVAANASCGTGSEIPAPQMLSGVAVLASWPWRAGAQDNFGPLSQLDLLELKGSGARPTRLQLHRNSRVCSSTDVALASDAPSYLSLQRYSATGPDGAAARSLTGVNMSGSGANDRHVRVAIAGGTSLTVGAVVTISLTVAANSSCSGARGVPAAQELVGYVVIAGDGLVTEEALQAGTALAVRALGVETLGAVMARPGASSDASASAQLLGMLAAKEQELESGEIDLREFLAGQDFSLPLSSSASGLPSGLALWGRAAKYDIGSEIEDGPQVESDLFSGSFGVDYRFREGMLLGLGYGRHEQEGQYRNGGAAGSYQLDLNLYQPYAAARIGPGWLAAYGSQGTGELLIESLAGRAPPESNLKADYVGWGLGWYNDIEHWDLRLRAGASAGELEFEESSLELNAEAGTARLAVAYAPGRNLVVDIPMQPEFEVAWADEWGDAAGDASWLVALAFDYAGDGPLHLRAAYRRAVSGGGHHAGAELDVRVDPNRGGLGPSFALRPHYGIEAGTDLFEQAARPYDFTAGDDRGRRLQAEMAWGLPVSGGVLTPYGDWSMERRDHSRSLGLRLGTGAYGDWQLGWRSADRAADELHLELRIGD